ncbi:DoxX family protein [Stenotrophobium rhamnosiphilum]|uniref:DoxX family protein n=1 Tax=Stenotrophobium rhamnosiphilum TaxID=2029166 RepID=A0A2T5MGT1_9GAMM|nr:DoxX family protein [Stenotrophobium rhamnosiphilum]PTU31739.1 DoxX family protein [Stenotrophobium rhamnosiphilum]
MSKLQNSAELTGRILMAAIFVLAGAGKITAYAGTQQYMAAMGVPGAMLPLVIALELGGGLLLIAGFQTRLIALALAGFSVASAALFHSNLGDQTQFIMFFKNVAMAGGFLIIAANGPGAYSLDRRGN